MWAMNKIYKIIKKRFPLNTVATHHFGKILIAYQESGIAPPHLIAELETQDEGKFWSAIWESLLFWHFNSRGFKFRENMVKKSGQNGPDFGLLHNGKTIWVEAIVPAPVGIPPENLEPPCNIKRPKALSEPHEQMLLRWTHAIKTKKERVVEYIRDGIISEDDSIVIAVNSCRLQYFAFSETGISQFPYAVEATFPIGPLSIQISKEGKMTGPATNTQRYHILKVNGSAVPTDNFLNPEYGVISGVLGSHQRDLWRMAPFHLSLVHNPLAIAPMPKKIFGAAKEFVCDLGEKSFSLRNLSMPG